MDFVVFGFGVSALLMLGGFGLRDLGPWLFGSAKDETALPEFEGAKATIRKQTLASIGNAVSAAGAGVAVVTVAALFGKTTDEIGAIVVGVSLVLAAVGVGAWSYDIFRRYRAAMDIVITQENSVRSRIQARDARNRSLRPDPNSIPTAATTSRPSRGKPAEAVEPTPITAKPISNPAPVETADEAIEEIDLDAPLPAWHSTDVERRVPVEPAFSPAVEPDASNESSPIEPASADVTDYDELKAPATTPVVRSTFAPTTSPPIVTPLLDDALIDEAVRIEPVSRLSSRGGAPSWLFDDLESDLGQQGSDQDDPIDRFRDAKPVSRPSALERMLAEDKAKRDKPSGNDSDDEN